MWGYFFDFVSGCFLLAVSRWFALGFHSGFVLVAPGRFFWFCFRVVSFWFCFWLFFFFFGNWLLLLNTFMRYFSVVPAVATASNPLGHGDVGGRDLTTHLAARPQLPPQQRNTKRQKRLEERGRGTRQSAKSLVEPLSGILKASGGRGITHLAYHAGQD